MPSEVVLGLVAVSLLGTALVAFAWDLVMEGHFGDAAEKTARRLIGLVAGAVTVAITVLFTGIEMIPEATAVLVGLVGLGGWAAGISWDMAAAVMVLVYIIGAAIRDPSINSGGR